MNDLANFLSRVEPPRPGEYRRPRDAATLVLLDGDAHAPRVLLGRRHERHAFMPGKFVFPGGGVDSADADVPVSRPLDEVSERRLLYRLRKPSPGRVRALALAAIRETCEETGLMIGERDGGANHAWPPAWEPFARLGLVPNLGAVRFVARAVTPPGRPRRYDTRFFVAHRRDIAAELPDVTGPHAELVELRWLAFDEARELNLPNITKVVLAEIEAHLRSNPASPPPVPFYYFRHGRARRDEIP